MNEKENSEKDSDKTGIIGLIGCLIFFFSIPFGYAVMFMGVYGFDALLFFFLFLLGIVLMHIGFSSYDKEEEEDELAL